MSLKRETLAPLKKGSSKSAHCGDRRSDIVPVFGKDLANSKPMTLHSMPPRALKQATMDSVWNYLKDIRRLKRISMGI